jgi:hypothetical protein
MSKDTTMDAILNYILTIPLYTLFVILQRSLRNIWVNREDQETFFNSVADGLLDGGYTTEEAIQAVFTRLGIYREVPQYGECGFRCDGRCQTCIRLGGGGDGGLSYNESGYWD